MSKIFYTTTILGNGHWSLEVRRGTLMKITDLEGGANVGMLFYNPRNLLERYNAPDTLKCQHTFKLQRGNCLYSDMGRIFASIIEDYSANGEGNWHDTVCGNSNAQQIEKQFGKRDYQKDRNSWLQNGSDAFLVELAKYGLGRADMAANINWFSKVIADDSGNIKLDTKNQAAGNSVTLRFDMDTLLLLHACPHPLNQEKAYPFKPVQIELGEADPVGEDDYCKNFRPENQRGFQNNALYYLAAN
ncbi:urea carboxylase [Cellvibrio zantedeschiae]|uniref:Urea carboxylase n=1 Tax=Cellvibrio zantedeschiae TaxID=1237077 RepID=A0ABQ3B3Z6_9GAMM|nr:urea amidolyase associated protein UAAP1 [Cellvibrio zantedeschiae]GGY73581.1 urea carboxylase [Cellvibrio zantedeschiae]